MNVIENMNRIDDGYYVVPKLLPSCGSYHGFSNNDKFYSGRLREEEEVIITLKQNWCLFAKLKLPLSNITSRKKIKVETLEHVPQGDRQ